MSSPLCVHPNISFYFFLCLFLSPSLYSALFNFSCYYVFFIFFNFNSLRPKTELVHWYTHTQHAQIQWVNRNATKTIANQIRFRFYLCTDFLTPANSTIYNLILSFGVTWDFLNIFHSLSATHLDVLDSLANRSLVQEWRMFAYYYLIFFGNSMGLFVSFFLHELQVQKKSVSLFTTHSCRVLYTIADDSELNEVK